MIIPTLTAFMLMSRLNTLVPVSEMFPVGQRFQSDKELSILSDLPPSIDLRFRDTPVQMQTQGNCTSFGLTAAMENALGDGTKLSEDHLWSLYHYPQLEPALKAATENAITLESFWPINGSPSPDYLAHAEHRLAKYEHLGANLEGAMRALASGVPLYLGFVVSESVVKCEVHANPQSPSFNAGHAVEVVGYNQAKQEFLIKNSWGSTCGEKGYQYIPFQYCSREGMFCDMYTIKPI